MCSLATQLLHSLGSCRGGAAVWQGTSAILRAITIVLKECRECTCSEAAHPLSALLLQNWSLISQAMNDAIANVDHHGCCDLPSSFGNLLSSAASLRNASNIVPHLARSLAIGFTHAPHGSWLQCVSDLSNCESVRAPHAEAFSQLLRELQHAFMQALQAFKSGPTALLVRRGRRHAPTVVCGVRLTTVFSAQER